MLHASKPVAFGYSSVHLNCLRGHDMITVMREKQFVDISMCANLLVHLLEHTWHSAQQSGLENLEVLK